MGGKAMARAEIEIKDELLDQLSEDLFWEQYRDRPPLPADVAEKIVARVSGLSIRIWADEHPPPHFHVTYQGQDASFSILDCCRLPGVGGLERYERTIRDWWEKNKIRLIKEWNASRPTDCPVGPIATSLVQAQNQRTLDVEQALQAVQAALQINKSRNVDLGRGESFGFLGFDFRRIRSRE